MTMETLSMAHLIIFSLYTKSLAFIFIFLLLYIAQTYRSGRN